jgi:hypothetical protein
MCARPAVTPLRPFPVDLIESRDPPNSGERIQKLGDFQFATSQHGLAVAEQQHVKVVIEQFAQRSFKLRGIIEFGLWNQAQRARRVADDRVAQEQDAAHFA